MADHMVYQIRAQWSLPPEKPTDCTGEAISWRPPGQDGWVLSWDIAHAANPLPWCMDITKQKVLQIASMLPLALPFD